LTRATKAGGGPDEPVFAPPAMDGCRMWVGNDRVGNDIVRIVVAVLRGPLDVFK
jgi:hypothetical protein